ncbi:MAG: response regulator [Gemmataceae bacterium]|nr:response regulator [Gemmataceae bacterium]MDW8263934.1 response regulator [Gemmataceae bacterium]
MNRSVTPPPNPSPGTGPVALPGGHRKHWSPIRKCRYAAFGYFGLTGLLAATILVGWASVGFPATPKGPWITHLLDYSISTAWPTAVGLVLMTLTAGLHLMAGRRRALRRPLFLVLGFVLVWSVGQLTEFVFSKIDPSLRETGPTWWTFLMTPFRRSGMSPGTAGNFLATVLVVHHLMMRPSARWRDRAAVGSVLLVGVNLLLLIGYEYHHALFASILNIAVAFPTALAFFLLGMGLLAAAGPRNRVLRPFFGPSTQALLLRTFLPLFVVVIFGTFLLHEFIRAGDTEGEGVWESFRILFAGYWIFGVVLVVGWVVARLSHRVGAELEQARAELMTALQELRVARDKAQAAAVARDLFLAQVSHELRTPLNHILGFCQLLELSNLDAAQQGDLRKIHQAGEHLLCLINDILDYQKVIMGQVPLDIEELEVGPLIRDIADTMEPKIRERGNRLVIDVPSALGRVCADRRRFRQILTNLLSNAAKFTRQGTVTIRAARDQAEGGDWVAVAVIDTGKGISAADQARLFQPFGKLTDKQENPEGTGLGLAICKNLCERMGGQITVASEVGRGSTFTFRLPAAAGPVEAAARPPAAPPPRRPAVAEQRRPGRDVVMVIDDDPQVQELMQRFLEGQGFAVYPVTNGLHALEVVKEVRPAVITLDVMLPGIDGWGILAALKNDAETADIPVVMVSIVDERTKGFALGAAEFVTKPIDWDRLAQLLRKYQETTIGPVLVVDDDPSLREVCRRQLQSQGWTVLEAEHGQAALAAMRQNRPAIILLDLMMPVMDGFEFLQELRQHPEWRTVPVIVVTAKQLTPDDRERLAGSVQEILEKHRCAIDELFDEVLERVRYHITAAASSKEGVPHG